MDGSYIDRLKENMREQIHILEKIYGSDNMVIENNGASGDRFTFLDNYIEEHDSYIERLQELQSDSDIISEYISKHPEIIRSLTSSQRNEILSFASEIEGKTDAVRQIETKAKTVTDRIIAERRKELAGARRNTGVINDHYRTPSAVSLIGESSFDIQN